MCFRMFTLAASASLVESSYENVMFADPTFTLYPSLPSLPPTSPKTATTTSRRSPPCTWSCVCVAVGRCTALWLVPVRSRGRRPRLRSRRSARPPVAARRSVCSTLVVSWTWPLVWVGNDWDRIAMRTRCRSKELLVVYLSAWRRGRGGVDLSEG